MRPMPACAQPAAARLHHVLTRAPMAVCCADSYSCGSAGVMRSATMWLGIAGGMLMTVLMSKVGGRAAGGLVRCGQPSGPFWEDGPQNVQTATMNTAVPPSIRPPPAER